MFDLSDTCDACEGAGEFCVYCGNVPDNCNCSGVFEGEDCDECDGNGYIEQEEDEEDWIDDAYAEPDMEEDD